MIEIDMGSKGAIAPTTTTAPLTNYAAYGGVWPSFVCLGVQCLRFVEKLEILLPQHSSNISSKRQFQKSISIIIRLALMAFVLNNILMELEIMIFDLRIFFL